LTGDDDITGLDRSLSKWVDAPRREMKRDLLWAYLVRLCLHRMVRRLFWLGNEQELLIDCSHVCYSILVLDRIVAPFSAAITNKGADAVIHTVPVLGHHWSQLAILWFVGIFVQPMAWPGLFGAR
jgi:hypothetical protein